MVPGVYRRPVPPLGSSPDEFTGEPARRSRSPRTTIVGLIILAAVAALCSGWSVHSSETSRAQVRSREVILACQSEIVQRLGWPFPPRFSHETTTKDADGFEVRGILAGLDPAGLQVVDPFSCLVTGADDNWTVAGVLGLPQTPEQQGTG